VDCQSCVTFVIDVVGTLGLSIGPNITSNKITLDSTGKPITTGIVRKLPMYCSETLDRPDHALVKEPGTDNGVRFYVAEGSPVNAGPTASFAW
jgi:hypothetical protein